MGAIVKSGSQRTSLQVGNKNEHTLGSMGSLFPYMKE
jgi:hypothetical protein